MSQTQHTLFLSAGQMKALSALYPEQNVTITQMDLLMGGDYAGHLMVSLALNSTYVHLDRDGNIVVKDAR